MASGPSTSPLRQILEGRLSQLSFEVDGLFAEAREGARREFADQLNQAVRRILQAADQEELGATLLDAAGAFASGAAWFRIAGEAAKGERIRGVPEEAAGAFRALEIPLASAAALAGAVESRDPVIAAATPREVSEDLARLLGHPPEGRVSIFPVVVRDRVPALLYAWGSVQDPAIELLTQVTAAAWTAMPDRRRHARPLGPPSARGAADPSPRATLRARAGGRDAPVPSGRGAGGPRRAQSLRYAPQFHRRRARSLSPVVLRALLEYGRLPSPGAGAHPGQ